MERDFQAKLKAIIEDTKKLANKEIEDKIKLFQ